jgi:hypothetical protein
VIHTSPEVRMVYLVASVVIEGIVLFAMDRLHGAHGVIGQRQAPRTAMLGLLATLFVAGMNFAIYTLVPENVSGGSLRTFVAAAHIRNLTVYCAVALDAAAFIQLFGGWRLLRRRGRGMAWPRQTSAERVEDNYAPSQPDDTAALPRPREQSPPAARH